MSSRPWPVVIVAAAVIVAAVSGLRLRNDLSRLEQLDDTMSWIEHTYEVREACDTLLLAHVQGNTARIDRAMSRLQTLTRDNADQQARLAALQRAMAAGSPVEPLAADIRAAEENLMRQRRNASSEAYRAAVDARIITTAAQMALLVGLALVAILQIRARDRAAAALFAEREQLRVTLSSIGDGVIVTDRANRVTMLNPIAEALTGWRASEANGRPIQDVFHILNEETRQPAADPTDRVLRGGAVQGLANHTILVARDGAEHPIDDSGAPIRGANGALEGAILVFRDIAEQRARERALRESEQRYREAAASASEANAIKDNFLALLSHELRTPLNAMLGWTQMIRTGVAHGPMLERAVAAIDRNANLQFRLVEELLDLSRIVSGKFQMQRQPLDFTATVAAAVEALRPTIGGRTLIVDLPEPGDPLMVLGDTHRIQQVVTNIVGNAIKFTNDTDAIVVSVRRDGHRVEMAVRDTGRGIAPDVLPHVFEQFRQGRHGDALQSGGLGLGLAIVRRIVEGHGGGITAESEEGHGATFRTTWPLMTKADEMFSAAEGRSVIQATGDLANESADRRAEVSLRTLAAVIENSHDFIGVCTPEFEPIYINAAGRRMVGIDPAADVRQFAVREFFMPDDLTRIDREGIPALLSTGHWTGLVRFRHFRTGDPIFTMWNAFVVKDDTGAPIAIATISPDLGKLRESAGAV